MAAHDDFCQHHPPGAGRPPRPRSAGVRRRTRRGSRRCDSRRADNRPAQRAGGGFAPAPREDRASRAILARRTRRSGRRCRTQARAVGGFSAPGGSGGMVDIRAAHSGAPRRSCGARGADRTGRGDPAVRGPRSLSSTRSRRATHGANPSWPRWAALSGGNGCASKARCYTTHPCDNRIPRRHVAADVMDPFASPDLVR